jgi:hypothetical protein
MSLELLVIVLLIIGGFMGWLARDAKARIEEIKKRRR